MTKQINSQTIAQCFIILFITVPWVILYQHCYKDLDPITQVSYIRAIVSFYILVHGGWADWSNWDECSRTCGTGLMKRSRQCSNPYPGPYGNPCFGDYTETKQCLLQECMLMGVYLYIQIVLQECMPVGVYLYI